MKKQVTRKYVILNISKPSPITQQPKNSWKLLEEKYLLKILKCLGKSPEENYFKECLEEQELRAHMALVTRPEPKILLGTRVIDFIFLARQEASNLSKH